MSVQPKTSRSELVASQIEAMILDGRIRVGQRLPAERVLCQQLQVSRNSLREALRALRARGIIESRRGSGSYVCFFQEFQPDTPLQTLLRSHPQTSDHLLEVRRLLEGEAAYLAAERSTEEDIHLIGTAFAEMENVNPRHDMSRSHAERDLAFHQSIYAAAHNPLLLLALNSIRELLQVYMMDTSDKLYPQLLNRRALLTQHRRIFRAIEKRNPAQARRAAIAHVDAVAKRLAEINS